MKEIYVSPVFGIAVTLLFYVCGLAAHRRVAWLHPLVVTCAGLALFLRLFGVSLDQYEIGGDMVAWFLGPATVALAVPMYKHGRALRESLGALVPAVAAGALVGMVTAGGLAWLLGAPLPIVMGAVP